MSCFQQTAKLRKGGIFVAWEATQLLKLLQIISTALCRKFPCKPWKNVTGS
jgi:hypothetical protein